MTISVVPKNKKRFYKRWWFKLLVIFAILAIGVGVFSFKAGSILNKISKKDTSILASLKGVISNGNIEETEDGRTNVLLLGMRGAGVTGGGLLADTIMVASLKKGENKVALISIPRDLYVKIPNENYYAKINSVFAHGEEKGSGGGIKEMKQVIEEVTGQPIHYVATINFAGFEQLIDAVGGIDIELKEPFSEPLQFHQEHVCDPNVFTIKSGRTQKKIDHRGKVVAEYPLCYNHDEECGGVFSLPAGKNHLDGEKALCYVRSRMTSNDYERAKRQQVVLHLLKDKLSSQGTLTSFSKLNRILNTLGKNVSTDMSTAEMKKFYSRYSKMDNPEIFQRVFENSPEGLLMVPQNVPATVGFVLAPRTGIGNYSELQDVSEHIFEIAPQSDIKPVKEYQSPKKSEEGE